VAEELPVRVARKAAEEDVDLAAAIKQSYVEIDCAMREKSFVVSEDGVTGGTTAASLFIRNGVLYAANSGDSRIICVQNGVKFNLTSDHRPTVPAELNRIRRSGCSVSFNRVGSVLAVSRALGDYEFKDADLPAEEMAVTPVPEVRSLQLTHPGNFDFILLATDGLFDYLSERKVVRYVVRMRRSSIPLERICSHILLDLEHNSNNCFGQCPRELDNVTVILAVPHGESGGCSDFFLTGRRRKSLVIINPNTHG